MPLRKAQFVLNHPQKLKNKEKFGLDCLPGKLNIRLSESNDSFSRTESVLVKF